MSRKQRTIADYFGDQAQHLRDHLRKATDPATLAGALSRIHRAIPTTRSLTLDQLQDTFRRGQALAVIASEQHASNWAAFRKKLEAGEIDGGATEPDPIGEAVMEIVGQIFEGWAFMAEGSTTAGLQVLRDEAQLNLHKLVLDATEIDDRTSGTMGQPRERSDVAGTRASGARLNRSIFIDRPIRRPAEHGERVVAAIRKDHGRCGQRTCTIEAAIRAGAPFTAAAAMITFAGSEAAPATEKALTDIGLTALLGIGCETGAPDRAIYEQYLADWSTPCVWCDAINWTDAEWGEGGDCGSCGRRLHVDAEWVDAVLERMKELGKEASSDDDGDPPAPEWAAPGGKCGQCLERKATGHDALCDRCRERWSIPGVPKMSFPEKAEDCYTAWLALEESADELRHGVDSLALVRPPAGCRSLYSETFAEHIRSTIGLILDEEVIAFLEGKREAIVWQHAEDTARIWYFSERPAHYAWSKVREGVAVGKNGSGWIPALLDGVNR